LAELERRIISIDKSNIFRALVLFREQHLVHAIEGSSDGTKYELCYSHDHEHDDDQHPHFYCEKCQQTYCLNDAELPEILLPQGFEAHSSNLMIKGLCPHCKK
jgi:Fur family ferric uptake transcriptional regulator